MLRVPKHRATSVLMSLTLVQPSFILCHGHTQNCPSYTRPATLLLCSVQGRGHVLTTLIGTQGVWITSSCPAPRARDTGLHRPRCLIHSGLEFLLALHVTVNSCTTPRHHGRIAHQPGDVPYGGFGTDVLCYPPPSHGSSRFEVDG